MKLSGETGKRTLHCYASGCDGDWEAICLDLDVAVQGASFEEVRQSLQEAVALYLEAVNALPLEQRTHLLHRPAPLGMRLKFALQAVQSLVRGDGDDRYHHQFTMPLAA